MEDTTDAARRPADEFGDPAETGRLPEGSEVTSGPVTGAVTGGGTGRRPTRPRRAARELVGEAADNTVRLRGRVSSAPVDKDLPSGAVITTFRMSVPRARTAMTAGSVQTVDWVDCTVWAQRCRRQVTRWQVGDAVEVSGALRRRFFRAGAGSSTRLEVEVLTATRPRRPPPADG
jgi:single-strand DNA-binding protein